MFDTFFVHNLYKSGLYIKSNILQFLLDDLIVVLH